MFKLLKEKIRKALGKISQDIEKTQVQESSKGIVSKVAEKIITTKISSEKFDDLFSDLELTLLENNVAFDVMQKIKDDLRKKLVGVSITRGKVAKKIKEDLRMVIIELLDFKSIDFAEEVKRKKPLILLFIGINGSGKTTTIAKLAKRFQDAGLNSIIAASDTFRAAAINQLEEHGRKLGIKVIKHDYGADPAAVAFDAVQHAQAKKIDIVLIDTAGRLHSNKNLIDEVKKIKRVVRPDFTIFVGESITGNDCIEQAQVFNNEIGFDGIILTKADVDDKGGTALSIGFVTKKPILYMANGQDYKNIDLFDVNKIVEALGLSD